MIGENRSETQRIHFLDGLRGWAALGVLMSHVWGCWLFRLPGAAELRRIINLTPLGVVMDGNYDVFVFFVVSGFALAYPTLVSTRRYRTIAGMALTRYTRLTIPVLAACLFIQALWSAGLFKNLVVAPAINNTWLPSFYAFNPRPGEIWSFIFHDVYFSYDSTRSWNGVLWTMSIELVASFWLFKMLILPTRWLRIPLAVYMAYINFGQSYFGFPVGWLIAEIAVVFGWLSKEPSRPRLLAGWTLIAGSLGFGFVARHYNYYNLSLLQHFDIQEIGAAVLVLGVTLSRCRFLSNRLSAFLGKISFPLYLVHLPIICSFGCGLYLFLASHMGDLGAVIFVGVPTMTAAIGTAVLFSILVEDYAVGAVKRALLGALDIAWRIFVEPLKALLFEGGWLPQAIGQSRPPAAMGLVSTEKN